MAGGHQGHLHHVAHGDAMLGGPGGAHVELGLDLRAAPGPAAHLDRDDAVGRGHLHDAARALHATYWHSGFGVPLARGCVNLSTGDAHWVFDWIQEGDWVWVWDPTGQTPTGGAALTVTWLDSSSDCFGNVTDLWASDALLTSTPGIWLELSSHLTAPPNTGSAFVGVQMGINTGSPPLNLNVDGLRFVFDPYLRGFLFADDLEIGSACRWDSATP